MFWNVPRYGGAPPRTYFQLGTARWSSGPLGQTMGSAGLTCLALGFPWFVRAGPDHQNTAKRYGKRAPDRQNTAKRDGKRTPDRQNAAKCDGKCTPDRQNTAKRDGKCTLHRKDTARRHGRDRSRASLAPNTETAPESTGVAPLQNRTPRELAGSMRRLGVQGLSHPFKIILPQF